MSNCTAHGDHHSHPRHGGACCPLHMIVGGFARGEQAMLAEGPETLVSFGDVTPKEPSHRCNQDRSATEGLYERLRPDQLLVFRGARAITMRGQEVLDHQDVHVRGGRIENVRPSGEPLPDGAVIVDASGKTLIPGLSEIHAHVFTDSWAQGLGTMLKGKEDAGEYVLPYDLMQFLLLGNGITKVEVMAGCPDTLWMRESVLDGSLVGPRYSVGSPLIDGPKPMHSPVMSYRVGDYDGGRAAADEIVRMGFDFAKPYSMLPAEAYRGLMEGCAKHGVRVMGHVPTAVGIEFAAAQGQGGIAHAAELFYWEPGPERRDPERRKRLLDCMAKAGTYLQATLVVVNRAGLRSGEMGRSDYPGTEWMNPFQVALYTEGSPLLSAIRAPKFDFLYDGAFELSCQVAREAHAAGVRVLTGTDFPNPLVIEGFSLHEELQLLVERCGFSPHEALHASTRVTAEYHGEGAADGTVSEGGIAELVLLDGDPLTEISATRRIDTVLARDALLRKPALDEGWSRVRAAYDAMPPAEIEMPADSPYVDKKDAN